MGPALSMRSVDGQRAQEDGQKRRWEGRRGGVGTEELPLADRRWAERRRWRIVDGEAKQVAKRAGKMATTRTRKKQENKQKSTMISATTDKRCNAVHEPG